MKKTLFLPFGPQHIYVHNYTIFLFIYKDDIYENPLLAKQNNIFFYFFIFLFYNTKIKTRPITSKIDRGGCRLLFKSAYPPPPPTPYCVRALLLRAMTLIIRQQHLNTALPTHRFFSSAFFLVTRP